MDNKNKTLVHLSPKKVVNFLYKIGIFLVFAHLIGVFSKYCFRHPKVYGLIPFFDLDKEQNIPSLFSTGLFSLNSILFLLIWRVKRHTDKRYRVWLFLSGLFFFLILDEFCEIHESISTPFKSALNTSGFLAFAWVIPYGIAGILLSIYLFRFVWSQDKKIRNLFILSALSYFIGAIGFEMLGAAYSTSKECDIVCGLLTMCEESLEMNGLIMLVYTLLSVLNEQSWVIEITELSKN